MCAAFEVVFGEQARLPPANWHLPCVLPKTWKKFEYVIVGGGTAGLARHWCWAGGRVYSSTPGDQLAGRPRDRGLLGGDWPSTPPTSTRRYRCPRGAGVVFAEARFVLELADPGAASTRPPASPALKACSVPVLSRRKSPSRRVTAVLGVDGWTGDLLLAEQQRCGRIGVAESVTRRHGRR